MPNIPNQTGQGNAPVVSIWRDPIDITGFDEVDPIVKYSVQYNLNIMLVDELGIETVCPLIMDTLNDAMETALCFFPDGTTFWGKQNCIEVHVGNQQVATITERKVR